MADFSTWAKGGSTGGGPSGQPAADDPFAFRKRAAGRVFGGGGSTPTGDQPTSGSTPGTYSVNVLNPVSTAQQAQVETANLFEGLKVAVFGTSQPDTFGEHGGLLGNVPGIGAVGRAVSETIASTGGAIGTVPGHAADFVGGALERVSLPNQPDFTPVLKQEFDAIPEGELKAKYQKLMAEDNGFLGTGALSADAHFMSAAIREYKDSPDAPPSLLGGKWTMPGSAAESLGLLFDSLGTAQVGSERLLAGAGLGFGDGQNRLQEIMGVGQGKREFSTAIEGDHKAMNPTEEVVYKKVSEGTWTETQALDYLASHASGLSHDMATELALSVITDPLTLTAAVLSGGAALGVKGAAAAKTFSAMGKTLQVAREAGVGLKGLDAVDNAAKVAKLESGLASWVAKEAGTSSRFNLYGKYVQETKSGTEFLKFVGEKYTGAQGTYLGKSAKVARTIVDPMHALGPLHMPGWNANIDLLSDAVPKAVSQAAGDVNHLKVFNMMDGISSDVGKEFVDNFGIYSGNVMRRVVARLHRGTMIARGDAEALRMSAVQELGVDTSGLLANHKSDILTRITEESSRWRQQLWTAEDNLNLAGRMETLYDTAGLSQTEWLAKMTKEGWNADMKSLLHQSTYGKATDRLLKVYADTQNSVLPLSNKYRRLVLINQQTLTKQGAEGILERIGSHGADDAKALDEIVAAQQLYPELLYIKPDITDVRGTITQFESFVKKRMSSLPMQVVDDELKQMEPAWQQLSADLHGSFNLGFRPEDEFLWGLQRSDKTEGALHAVGDVWTDHVGLEGAGFRPARVVPTNVLGQTIPGGIASVAKAVAKPVDYIEAMSRVMRGKVTGAMITDAARVKFNKLSFERHGMTKEQGSSVWNALQEMMQSQDNVFHPRGFTAGTIWKNTSDAIPLELRTGPEKITQREMLALVLDAYDGDVRLIGVTQKLTAKAKAVVGNATGVNFLGQIAESVYPTMKFRLNSVFQMQERIEPWVLNAQRGAHVAAGGNMSTEDLYTSRLLERMTELSINRMSDMDQGEYAAQAVFGKATERAMSNPTSKMGRLKSAGATFADTKGAKRVNALQTFKKGLGKETRDIWETAKPGEFDKMLTDASARAGHLVHEDDFAVQLLAEKYLGNDILIERFKNASGIPQNAWKKDFMAAIAPGEWHTPTHLGEVKRLELDNMARLMDFSMGVGNPIVSQAGIREAIASGRLSLDDVSKALRLHGASPDYIQRVENAFNFHWEGFWGQVESKFGLTAQQRMSLEDMIARTAEMRGVTPVDYMSQIYSPVIIDGIDGSVGSLGDAAKLLNIVSPSGATTVPNRGLATLASAGGKGTREDLINQLAATFSHHLDPSSKAALLREWHPDLVNAVQNSVFDMDMRSIESMWNSDMTDRLAQELTGQLAHSATDIWHGELPRNLAETQARAAFKDATKNYLYTIPGQRTPILRTKKRFSDSFLAADPVLQDRLAGTVARWQAVFPSLPVPHLTIDDIARYAGPQDTITAETMAVALAVGGDRSHAVVLGTGHFGADWASVEAQRTAANESTRQIWHFEKNGMLTQRVTNIGVPHNADMTPEGILRHELMHDITAHIELRSAADPAYKARAAAFQQVKADFFDSPAMRSLSEYGAASPDEALSELASVTFNPKWDPATHVGGTPMPGAPAGRLATRPGGLSNEDLPDFLERLDQQMTHYAGSRFSNDMVPDIKILMKDIEDHLALNETAQTTGIQSMIDSSQRAIDDAVLELDQLMTAEQMDLLVSQADLMSQPNMSGFQTLAEASDALKQSLEDLGLYVPPPPVSANPDVVRATQAFGDWTKRVMGQGLADPNNAVHGGLLHDLGALDTTAAAPYNKTEALMYDAVSEAMSRKWDDAYRLQYFAQTRSMLERSVNHPMLGIYPASYMWGKILPEMVRFVASEPFGVKTGAMAYAMLNVQKQIAIQSEFDPAFREKMDSLGSNELLWMIGYMLPSVPWDVPSSFPMWMRNTAQRGLDAQAAVDAGGVQPDNTVQPVTMLTDALKPLDPARQVKQWTQPFNALADNKDIPATNAEGPIKGADLGSTLEDIIQSLTDVLSGH